ncbi:hypothetical protein EMGBS1_06380 [Chloroflexota bacterium]|nr:hypothetical protein EMGBS1_06380 [Chloroflexota bacterium]
MYYAAHLVGGGVWGVLNAALLNRLIERVPEDDRPGHMALHNICAAPWYSVRFLVWLRCWPELWVCERRCSLAPVCGWWRDLCFGFTAEPADR